MKRCPHCSVRLLILKSVEGPNIVVHSALGVRPYLDCRDYRTRIDPREWSSLPKFSFVWVV